MTRYLAFLVAGLVATAGQESAPHRLAGTRIALASSVKTISGVRELRDGRLLLSDAKAPAVYLVEPATGRMEQIGAIGGGALDYAQPGGFYGPHGDSALILDRGLAKVLVVSSRGAIVGSRSIKRRGITESSDEDVDRQRIDGRGLAYFPLVGRFAFGVAAGEAVTDSVPLVRFDASVQRADTVAFLRKQEEHVTQASEHVRLSQVVTGSPLDDYGVAADGSVAVVRGSPYRVDWISPRGTVKRGESYPVQAIAFTQPEKDSIVAAAAKARGVSVSAAGSDASSSTPQPHFFAATKAPFDAGSVSVSPQGEVWVARTQARAAAGEGTLFDVFDRNGQRTHRVLLDPGARIIGFGPAAVYAIQRAASGKITLLKYKI